MQERQTAELSNAFHLYRQKYSGIWENPTGNLEHGHEERGDLPFETCRLETCCHPVSVVVCSHELGLGIQGLCGPATLSLDERGSGTPGLSCEELGVHSGQLRHAQAEAQTTERSIKGEGEDPAKIEWLTFPCCSSL